MLRTRALSRSKFTVLKQVANRIELNLCFCGNLEKSISIPKCGSEPYLNEMGVVKVTLNPQISRCIAKLEPQARLLINYITHPESCSHQPVFKSLANAVPTYWAVWCHIRHKNIAP